MPLYKNKYFRLGVILGIFVLSFFTVLPRVSLWENGPHVGGYYFSFLGDKVVLDLQDFKKGLDLEGGVRVVMLADMEGIEGSERDKALESAKEVISRRVDLLGVSEPHIATLKTGEDYRIVVEVPGLENTKEAIDLIGETAQLHFKVLKEDLEWDDSKFFEYFYEPSSWVDSGVSGADLDGVDVLIGQSNDLSSGGGPQIQLKFSNEGRRKFSELAKANVGRPVALFLDEGLSPLSAPVISPELADGVINDPVISGNFDLETAKNLSIQLRAGALPVAVSVMQQETIGATLGSESIQKSFFAGAVGLVIVALFLIFKYGKLGVLASFSLIVYSSVVLAIFKIIPVVLTLPGIAGFILSIGMATDANILIFERINEEISWGKPRNFAIQLGFDRAWNSIRDSNISSLITSFILFQFGSGPVRGFALTLAIGILVSLFSSIFVVRNLIEIFGLGKAGANEVPEVSEAIATGTEGAIA
jgi:preprotein translocase subunit SecD